MAICRGLDCDREESASGSITTYVSLSCETKLCLRNLKRTTQQQHHGGQWGNVICSSLHDMKIPSNVRAIPERAFSGCTSLTDVELSKALEVIGGGSAFFDCTSLLAVKIPPRIPAINQGTFYGCTSLKKAVLNEGLRIIDEDAFGKCSTLFGLTIPSPVM